MRNKWNRAAAAALLGGALAAGSVVWAGGAATAAPIELAPGISIGTSVGEDSDVTFESDGVTFHASFRTPPGGARAETAALLIPGSGPTDRNGNAPEGGFQPNTLAQLADELAHQGIPSLRFDKIGVGSTGAGLDSTGHGYEQQVSDAEAALATLNELTGTTPAQTTVLGHSEGGLTALVLGQRHGAAGLGLLAPLPMRYLDLLDAQIGAYVGRATESGDLSAEEADRVRADLPVAIASIRADGTVPEGLHPLLAEVALGQESARFLHEADKYDPPALAASLPATLPVLVTCSDRDLNVSCAQVERLGAAVAPEALTFAHLTTANHMLGELGPFPAIGPDGMAPLPLSGEFAPAQADWLWRVHPG